MKIAVFGAGYVGLSLSVLFARNKKLSVDLYDVNRDVIKSLNNKLPHIHDEDIKYSFQKVLKAIQKKLIIQYYGSGVSL